MTRRLSSIFILVLLFAVTAMIVGTLLDFIPWDIRRSLGYVVVPVAVLWFLWSWFKWHAKQRGTLKEGASVGGPPDFRLRARSKSSIASKGSSSINNSPRPTTAKEKPARLPLRV